MAKRPAVDNPALRFEEVGVIGEKAVESDVKAPTQDAQARAESRPADASPVEGDVKGITDLRPADFKKVEDEDNDPRPVLPEGFEDWQGYKLANGSARENFAYVIRYPGSVFAAGGRYHNAQNVEEYFDVEEGHIVPDGLFLIPTNYLINREAQGAVLRGQRAPERAARVDPLRRRNENQE